MRIEGIFDAVGGSKLAFGLTHSFARCREQLLKQLYWNNYKIMSNRYSDTCGPFNTYNGKVFSPVYLTSE